MALVAAALRAGPSDPDKEALDPAWPPVLIAVVLAAAIVVVVVGVVFVRRARAAARAGERGDGAGGS